MTATVQRPLIDRGPIQPTDLIWIHDSGYWLGLPRDSTEDEVQRAIATLQWLRRGDGPPAS